MSIVLRIGAVQPDTSIHKMAAVSGPVSSDACTAPEDVYAFHPPPQQTYSSCFGLPYQDHNYGAPPPPTPPQSPPPVVKVNGHIDVVEETVNIVVAKAVSELSEAVVEVGTDPPVDDSITRCICDYQHDDGYMICCDKCSVWQHIDCMCIDRNNIPDAYCCELCEPRVLDKKKARDLQTRKREEMTDSSATDTDPDEAAHHIALLQAQATANKKGKMKRTTKKEVSKDTKAQKLKKQKEKKKERKEKKSKLANTNNIDVSVTMSKMKMQNNKENAKKLPQMKSPKRNRSVDFQVAEPKKEPWNTSSSVSPWVDGYETARNNHYSSALQEILSVNKLNGQYADAIKQIGELQAQLCNVTEVKKNRKGLTASENIAENVAIIEYVGRVMLKHQYDTDNIFFKMLHPYVLFYSNFDNTNLCIDASNYGNDARFVRRSCAPNAEIRHIVSSGSIRFYIFSKQEIPQGAEVTIPFDFQYKDCSFNVECSCSKVNCAVSKRKRKRTNSQNRNMAETSPIVCRTSKRCQAQKAKEQEALAKKEEVAAPVIPPDTSFLESLANAAVAVSMAEQSLSEQTAPPPQESPKKEPPAELVAENILSSPLPTEEETEQDAADQEKKMTREERKMHAIMKAFEKLEKREERRKEALARLGTTKKPKVEKSQSEDMEIAPVVEAKPETPVEQKTAKGKRRKSHPARRRSRMSSGNSECTVVSEDSNTATPISAPTTPSPRADHSQQQCPKSTDKNFRFLKTKRHLMNEWLSEKTQSLVPAVTSAPASTAPASTPSPTAAQAPAPAKTEPLEVSVEETMFVTCLPSPRNTMEHLRRNSQSSCDRPGQGCSIGSAKKRWLRQAMCESTHSDSGKESPAPYCDGASPIHTPQLPSPGGSPPIDFVTPLKKRRLARESLSAEQPPTPSTLSPPLPVAMDESSNSTPSLYTHDGDASSVSANTASDQDTSQPVPMDQQSPLKGEKLEFGPVEAVTSEADSNVDSLGEKDQVGEGRSASETHPIPADSVTDSAHRGSEGAAAVIPMETEAGPVSTTLQCSPVKVKNELVDKLEDSAVASSDSVLPTLRTDKHGICSSTETVDSSQPCGVDTSGSPQAGTTPTVVKCENAQNNCIVSDSPTQPSPAVTSDSSLCVRTETLPNRTHVTCASDSSSSSSLTASLHSISSATPAKLDSTTSVNSAASESTSCVKPASSASTSCDRTRVFGGSSCVRYGSECQGSNTGSVGLCDSAEPSGLASASSRDVNCAHVPNSLQNTERTYSDTCVASSVTGSSDNGDLLGPGEANVAPSSCGPPVVDSLQQARQSSSPLTYSDSAVSSTSQAGPSLHPPLACADPSREVTETFSPGVSSTVSDYHREVATLPADSTRGAGIVLSAEPGCAPDSSVERSTSGSVPDLPQPPSQGSMTVMSADSTSAVPPPPPLPPPPPPQPPPPPCPTKKKVSLLEYRNRLKNKDPVPSSSRGSNSGQPVTPGTSPGSGCTTPTLAPLPFFNPSSPGRTEYKDGFVSPVKNDEDVRWPGRSRDKPLSLTERLRMEFGLGDSDEEDNSPEKEDGQREDSVTPPPPPPPPTVPPPAPVTPIDPSGTNGGHVAGHLVPGPAFVHHDPRTHGPISQGSRLPPQPVPPPAVSPQMRHGPSVTPPARYPPSLLTMPVYPPQPAGPHPPARSPHPPARTVSPQMFNHSPPPPPPSSSQQQHFSGGHHLRNHKGGVSSSSRAAASHHPAVYSTPGPSQRPSKQPSETMGPQRAKRHGGQPSYSQNQYSAHAPARPPHYLAGGTPPPHPPHHAAASSQSRPGKPQTASKPSPRNNYQSHSYNHKKYY